jgi:hypothetical protein
MATGYRSYVQLLLLLVGLALLLLIPGYAVTRKLGGVEAVAGMWWGCGLTFFAAAVGGLPQVLVSRPPREAGALALGSLATRMGITLFGTLAILLTADVPRSSFLLWVAVSYIAFLAVDIVFVVTRNRAEAD